MNYRNENATPRDRYEAHSCTHSCDCVRRAQRPVQNIENGCARGYHDHQRYSRPLSRQANHGHGGNGRTPMQKGACGTDNGYLVREAPVAMVYSPMQLWRELYDPETGLTSGTIFKELDLPFYCTGCKRKENCQCQYR